MKIYLVSSCLLGIRTRYDGKILPADIYSDALAGAVCIPVCPEQLGGLPTPRTAADLLDGDGYDVLAGRTRVINRDGVDVTGNFILGAKQVVLIARQTRADRIILKAGSPSCGLYPKIGVTAALLQEEGFAVEEMG